MLNRAAGPYLHAAPPHGVTGLEAGRCERVRDRSFDTLEDAKAWLRRAATDEERGEFVDPRDGSITLADYIAMHWAPGRGGVPETQDNQERGARLHLVPHLGQLPLRNISAADLRAYIAELESTVSSVDHQRRHPVRTLLRPGSGFGLSPEDIDHARGVLYVRRQVQAIKGKLYCALPKGRKTRVVDMPSSVAEEFKRHVEAFPPVEVELPWGKPEAEGQRKKFSLLLTTRFGNAIAVSTWNTCTWKPALAKVGIIPPRAKGAKDWQWEAAPKDDFHVLRHTYASLMLEAGESVVTVARWLGDSSPAITLGYYAHFMPEAKRKGRTAIDGLLGRQGDLHASRNSPDSPQGC